jgi:multicomponent Na+:H+ antiporter subunit E
VRRLAALGIWAYIVWVLLTWTLTAEQQLIGVLVAIAVGLSMAPLGDVAAPWRLLDPRRFVGVLLLCTESSSPTLSSPVAYGRQVAHSRVG